MIASLLAATAGGAAGAIARGFCTAHLKQVTPAWFPFPTLIINAVACFALGALMAADPSRTLIALMGTGFLGGFSTMSTFSFETVEAIAHGESLKAIAYVGATLLVCLSCCLAGWTLIGG